MHKCIIVVAVLVLVLVVVVVNRSGSSSCSSSMSWSISECKATICCLCYMQEQARSNKFLQVIVSRRAAFDCFLQLRCVIGEAWHGHPITAAPLKRFLHLLGLT